MDKAQKGQTGTEAVRFYYSQVHDKRPQHQSLPCVTKASLVCLSVPHPSSRDARPAMMQRIPASISPVQLSPKRSLEGSADTSGYCTGGSIVRESRSSNGALPWSTLPERVGSLDMETRAPKTGPHMCPACDRGGFS